MNVHRTVCRMRFRRTGCTVQQCRAERFKTSYGCQTQGKLEGDKSNDQERSLQECHGVVHLWRTGKLHRSNPGSLSDYKRKPKANKLFWFSLQESPIALKQVTVRGTKCCFTRRHPWRASNHPAVPAYSLSPSRTKDPPFPPFPSYSHFSRICSLYLHEGLGWSTPKKFTNSGLLAQPVVYPRGHLVQLLTFLILLLLYFSKAAHTHALMQTPVVGQFMRYLQKGFFTCWGEKEEQQWAADSSEKILGLEETNFF